MYGKARRINKAMEVLNIMKRNNVKPSLIIYTNLIQASFKAKRLDYLIKLLEEIEKDGLKSNLLLSLLNLNL